MNKELITIYGVALVKFYYDDAKRYFIQQEEIRKSIENNKQLEIKTRIVKASKNNKTKNNNLIDIGNLMEGGDRN
jgi:hypothetical protein